MLVGDLTSLASLLWEVDANKQGENVYNRSPFRRAFSHPITNLEDFKITSKHIQTLSNTTNQS